MKLKVGFNSCLTKLQVVLDVFQPHMPGNVCFFNIFEKICRFRRSYPYKNEAFNWIFFEKYFNGFSSFCFYFNWDILVLGSGIKWRVSFNSLRGQKSDVVTHADGRVFFKARKKTKPGINYILFLLYLVGWAPSNSKNHILSQGATLNWKW